METLRDKIQVGNILIDDINEKYLVIEVFSNSVAVSPLDNWKNLSCEIMSYTAMDNEGWAIYGQKGIPDESNS